MWTLFGLSNCLKSGISSKVTHGMSLATLHPSMTTNQKKIMTTLSQTALEEAESHKSDLPVSMFGLAKVMESRAPNYSPVQVNKHKFCVLFPGDRNTKWFATRAEAQAVATAFNNGKLPNPAPNMNTHTKTPWKQEGNEIVGAVGTPDARVICKLAFGHVSPGPVFSYLDSEHLTDNETVTANAAFIVRAVNCHEELVRALQNAEAALEDIRQMAMSKKRINMADRTSLEMFAGCALLPVDAALTKATGGERK
jgi:hypothetical protein